MKIKTVLIVLLTTSFLFKSQAQKDTTQLKNSTEEINVSENKTSFKDNKPLKAILLSTALPGAGQVYNKQYWKVPVFYGALGTVAFSFDIFNKQYQKYKDGLIERQNYEAAFDTDSAFELILFPIETEVSKLTILKDQNRRNRDLSALVFLAVYVFNIIDATVYANLSDFDVSDDLSLRIQPEILPVYSIKNTNTIGLSLSIRF